ncbi:MAG: M1 family aminopeptidase [Gemmatimonadaceae bacterium]
MRAPTHRTSTCVTDTLTAVTGRAAALALRVVPLVCAAASIGLAQIPATHQPRPADWAIDAATLMGSGISHDLANYRSARIRDVTYDLDLDVTGRNTATGHVVVGFTRFGRGDAILDFRGPHLGAVVLNGTTLSAAVNNGMHVRLPAASLRTGHNTVARSFAAAIAPAGASVIRYHDATDGTDYLYTLLVPSDANQLFPCFDQPDLKARMALTLTVPSEWSAVSNGIIQQRTTSGSSSTIHFSRTKPISTYLIAFAAGPWAHVTRTVDGHPITMYVRASRAKDAEADSLILANGRAMKWLARYFDFAYPWPKLDFVLAPAFPFGGMEHPGAIFYNENSFIFRERATRPQRIAREATIYHEVAHQWFGDLVTMKWFDDLWLKEGFATYMAAKMRASLEPDSNAWETFYLQNKPAAYGVDRTEGTTPIWQSLTNLDQAKSNYGAIVYNKAPGVIKQLNYLVGDSAFRHGLHDYLIHHAYGNATWQDLLSSVGSAAKRPLAKWGEEYILRPGMPVIQQHVTVERGVLQSISLAQRPAQRISGPGPWPIRTQVLIRYPGGRMDHLLINLQSDSTVARFAGSMPPPEYVFANEGDNAYALVIPDSLSTRWLADSVSALADPLERAMGWDALWEQVRQRGITPTEFIAIAERSLPHERDEQILGAQLRHVTRAAEAYLSPEQRDSVLPGLEASLRTVAGDATRPYEIRKPNLDALIRVTRSAAGLSYLDQLLDSATAAGAPLRAPTRWAIITRLVATAFPDADARLAAESKADSTSEGRRYAFIARAATPDAAVKRDYFERYLNDPNLNEEWATSSLGAFNELDQQALTLRYLKPALDTLPWLQHNRRIFFIGSWLGGFLGGQSTPEAVATVREYLKSNPQLGADLRQKVLQAVDEMERTVEIREAAGAASAHKRETGASQTSGAPVSSSSLNGSVRRYLRNNLKNSP